MLTLSYCSALELVIIYRLCKFVSEMMLFSAMNYIPIPQILLKIGKYRVLFIIYSKDW